MSKIFITTLLLSSFALAQVNFINGFNDLKYRFMEKLFYHIRGDKIDVVGQWTKMDPQIFQKENEEVISRVICAVYHQYAPKDYKFSSVVNVTKQIVEGINYQVITEYINNEREVKSYSTLIYYASKFSFIQIVSCKPLNYPQKPFWTITIDGSGTQTLQQSSVAKYKISYAAINTGWIEVYEYFNIFKQNINEYQIINNAIVSQAVNAVEAKMKQQSTNHSESIYYFKQVTEVKKQVFDGTNYYILIDYVNKLKEIQSHQVIIYSKPWMGSYQVISSVQISIEYEFWREQRFLASEKLKKYWQDFCSTKRPWGM